MSKKVKKIIKIKPKSEDKIKKVLFNFNTKNKKDLTSVLIKNINFRIISNKINLFKDKASINLSKILKHKNTRFFIYNVKYYLKKHIVLSFLSFIKKIVIALTKTTINLQRKKSNRKEFFKKDNRIFKTKILNRIKYFFTPDNKYNWMPEFKGFVALVLATVFIINVLFFSNQMTQDLSKVVATTAYAKEEIMSGIDDVKTLNTDTAKSKFYLALNSFYNLNDELSFFSKVGFNFLGNFTNINTKDIESIIGNLENISQASLKFVDVEENNKDKNFLFKIQKANDYLNIINNNINDVNNKVSNINTTILPLEYKNKVNELKNKVSYINDSSKKILQTTELLRSVLGENDKKRYLLMFQNANEIRATGGFTGSYALVDINNGDIVKTEVPGGGIYDLQGGFYKDIEPPMPLQLLTNKWEIQDANWFLDFPKSAQKISNFFESSDNGSSVDGIIAINSNALADVLKLTGDISLDKYGVTLTQSNVVDEIQNIIKSNRLKTNKPKEIIVDLFSIISKKLFSIDNSDIINSISLLNNIVQDKNILAYFNNPSDQKIAENLGFSGEIATTKQDYLSINYSNVGASKTSQIIERNTMQKIKILPTGEVFTYLTINNKYPVISEMKDRNIDFIRVYTPLGSKLISANGFSDDVVVKNYIDPYGQQDKDLNPINEDKVKDLNTNTITYNDEGKTIFGNFLYLDSGDSKTIELVYKLPFKVDYDKIKKNKDYSYLLYIQSQPGIKNTNFDLTIETPNSILLSNKFILNQDKNILLNK